MSQSARPDELKMVEFRPGILNTKCFFYEKKDGSVILMAEAEAAMTGKHFKLLGVSKGEAYNACIASSGFVKGQKIPYEDAKKILKAAFDAELESARGHLETPHRDNVHFQGNVPDEVRKNFRPN